MTIKISDIRIYRIQDQHPKGDLLGYCSFIIDDKFRVAGVKILKDLSGEFDIRLLYPAKMNPEGASWTCFMPVDYNVKRSIVEEVDKIFKDCPAGTSPFSRWFRRHSGEKSKHYV